MDFLQRAGGLSQYFCDVCDHDIRRDEAVYADVYGDDAYVKAKVEHVHCHVARMRFEAMLDAATIARYVGSELAALAILDKAKVLMFKMRTAA